MEINVNGLNRPQQGFPASHYIYSRKHKWKEGLDSNIYTKQGRIWGKRTFNKTDYVKNFNLLIIKILLLRSSLVCQIGKYILIIIVLSLSVQAKRHIQELLLIRQ